MGFSLDILPAVSTYHEKCSLSICPSASDTDGSGHGGWGQEASLHAEKTNGISKNIQLEYTENSVDWAKNTNTSQLLQHLVYCFGLNEEKKIIVSHPSLIKALN